MMTKPSIHRVVTCFILSHQQQHPNDPKVAIFHRCDTMPTFASYWAGISGTIEKNETPYEAAQRELQEETNITSVSVSEQGGLYVNVPVSNKKIVRVYPFVVHLNNKNEDGKEDTNYDTDNNNVKLELRGTEHDQYQYVTISELIDLQKECVPGLVEAFHHATFGKYDTNISSQVRDWANDQENGASIMLQNALKIIEKYDNNKEQKFQVARQIRMLRPSMVPITNAMDLILQGDKEITLEALRNELHRSVEYGKKSIQELLDSKNKNNKDEKLKIITFSRSGTLQKILKPFIDQSKIDVICSESTPGNEGILFARDLGCRDSTTTGVTCVPDSEILQNLIPSSDSTDAAVDLVIIGSDCITPESIVNKIGTKVLCEKAKKYNIPVFCCADKFKLWDDIFPPPIETDFFEIVPLDLITKVIVPPSLPLEEESKKLIF